MHGLFTKIPILVEVHHGSDALRLDRDPDLDRRELSTACAFVNLSPFCSLERIKSKEGQQVGELAGRPDERQSFIIPTCSYKAQGSSRLVVDTRG
jgi:hypothetical protein